MHTESGREVRRIRRYRNRRLYDPARGGTITRRELAELVRDGYDVVVTDFTGLDITASVLAQVAQKEVTGRADPAVIELYRSVIAKGGEMSRKAINNLILAGLGALALTREKAEELIDTLIKRGEVAQGDRKSAVDDLIAKAEEQAKKFSATMKQKAADLRGVRRDEYERLKAEVEELRRAMAELRGGAAQKS